MQPLGATNTASGFLENSSDHSLYKCAVVTITTSAGHNAPIDFLFQ